MPQNTKKGTPEPQEGKPDAEKSEAAKQSYYYDDAHGYEDYDPNLDSDGDDDESRSGFRPVDVDGNISPPPLVETDKRK